jgi:Fe-S cluster assembly protein SufD
VFVDGVLAPALSDTLDTHASLTIRVLGRPSGDKAPAELDVERSSDAAFALLNDAFATDGVHISLDAPRGRAATASAPTRLELLFLASAPAQQGASYPRVRVDAAPQTRLTLIERHLSLDGDASFVDAALDLHVLEHACVEHHRLQQLGSRAIWLDSLSAHVAAGAAYHLHAFALGAQAARSTLHVRLAGEAAQLGLHAVAAADRQQVLDSYALVEHAAAHTRTEESFRGIAAGRARVGFNGKIIVRPGAHGADSQQSLRGLLAGPDAEIDVRPQLEIYTDDVRCSHGATAGKLDDMMLFYLLTRGIERDTAQRLLKWAFLEDVVSKVDIGELRRQIEASLAGQLKESEALKELL